MPLICPAINDQIWWSEPATYFHLDYKDEPIGMKLPDVALIWYRLDFTSDQWVPITGVRYKSMLFASICWAYNFAHMTQYNLTLKIVFPHNMYVIKFSFILWI